jgi:large subunit ribosomal protein L18
MDKKQSRLRRARQTRLKIAQLRVNRLAVHRTNTHIYASIIDASGSKILVFASSLEPELRKTLAGKGSNIAAATAKAAGITSVAFDRSGFKYHGRVKALADAAREGGLQF